MATHNTAGIEYAKLSETKEGDILVVDPGFPCMVTGPRTVRRDNHGLFLFCADGSHYLDGQCDDGDHMVGLTKPTP